MIKNIQIRHFKRWLVVSLVSCTLPLGFNTTEAIAQTSSGSGLNQLFRQINPAAGGAGVVARYSRRCRPLRRGPGCRRYRASAAAKLPAS